MLTGFVLGSVGGFCFAGFGGLLIGAISGLVLVGPSVFVLRHRQSMWPICF